MEKDRLHISPLFAGLTRPPMWAGITLDYLGLTALGTMCFVILSNNLFYVILYLPLHVFG